MTTRLLFTIVLLLGGAVSLGAQTVMVDYDAPAGTTIAQNQEWTPVLYVNGKPIVGTRPTCVGTTAIVCSFPLPDIGSALTASGPQTFRIALRDAVLGEGVPGAPLAKTRPSAPANLRFKEPAP